MRSNQSVPRPVIPASGCDSWIKVELCLLQELIFQPSSDCRIVAVLTEKEVDIPFREGTMTGKAADEVDNGTVS